MSTKPKKVVECQRIGGMLFYRRDLTPRVNTVQEWMAKGCPDGVYIHDELWALLAHKIPIVDAQESRGFWVRLREPQGLQPWSGVPTLLHQESKVRRASKLQLTHGLVIQQAAAVKIGTREIVC